jgi:hypothetical protein
MHHGIPSQDELVEVFPLEKLMIYIPPGSSIQRRDVSFAAPKSGQVVLAIDDCFVETE